LSFDRSEHQALQAYAAACFPKISVSDLEVILDHACEYGLTIDGVSYTNPSAIATKLSNLSATKPLHFGAYFEEIYTQLAKRWKPDRAPNPFQVRRVTTPREPLKVARLALTYRLSKRPNPLTWPAFTTLVEESIDLGINRPDHGIGKTMTKRMNNFLAAYMSSGSKFDSLLDWLEEEIQLRIEDPEKYPREAERKSMANELSLYRSRLRTLAFYPDFDDYQTGLLTPQQKEFEAAVLQTCKARLGPLLRSWNGYRYSRVAVALEMFRAFLEGNIRDADGLVEEMGRKPMGVGVRKHRYARAGDAWDTADHWGWYL
jgi:hypothetical protein